MNLHGTAGLLCKCPSVYPPSCIPCTIPSVPIRLILVRGTGNKVHQSLTAMCRGTSVMVKEQMQAGGAQRDTRSNINVMHKTQLRLKHNDKLHY